jgi:HK97 family phage major capsid protein
MAYTDRTDAGALIPEPVANEIIQELPKASAAVSLMRQARMSVKQERMPVLSALPTAHWVSGDVGFRTTSKVEWDNKYLIAEVLNVLVPIPKTVIADSKFDMWGEIKPRLVEALGAALDGTVFFGTNAPVTFPMNIAAAAIAAGNTVERGTAPQSKGGLAQDVNDLMGAVEGDGFGVNGFATYLAYKRWFRGARDTTGQKLLDVNTNTIEGQPIYYGSQDIFPRTAGTAEMFAADWTKFILGIRTDMTFEIWKEASIYDQANGNALLYALAQQGLVAMSVDFRCGWQVANPVTRENTDEDTRYPAAVLTQPAA